MSDSDFAITPDAARRLLDVETFEPEGAEAVVETLLRRFALTPTDRNKTKLVWSIRGLADARAAYLLAKLKDRTMSFNLHDPQRARRLLDAASLADSGPEARAKKALRAYADNATEANHAAAIDALNGLSEERRAAIRSLLP